MERASPASPKRGDRVKAGADYGLRSFILEFDEDRPGVATYLGSLLSGAGVEAFHRALQGEVAELLEDPRGISHRVLPSLLGIIRFILVDAALVPGMDCVALRNRILREGKLQDMLAGVYLACNNSSIRLAIMNSFLGIEDFFREAQRSLIEENILKSEWVLVGAYFQIAGEGMDRGAFLRRIIGLKNRYLLWGVMDCYIEVMNPEIEDFMDELRLVDDIVVKERIRHYYDKKAVMAAMYEENRLEMSAQEKALAGRNVFEFFKLFIVVLKGSFDGHYTEMELDAIAKEMWSRA